MIDLKLLRENPDIIKDGARAKNIEIDTDEIVRLDSEYRELSSVIQELYAKRNALSRERDIEGGRELKDEVASKESRLKELKDKLDRLLYAIPNLPLEGVPQGGADDFQVLETKGEPSKFSFEPRDHLELGEALDIIDVERAVKVSGSRFAYLKNEGVLLEFALVQYALDKLSKESFSPILPPALIKYDITEKLGYWTEGNNNNYYLVSDYEQVGDGHEIENKLYLIGTAEHSLVPMHKDEIFLSKDLPKKYIGFSPSFRREAGSYGKDTRGILRVHQFDKVEMVAFVKAEDDESERRKMLSISESLIGDLGLAFRVVKLASGDISFPTAETIDIETWMPSQNKYRETHSISTTTDFQARRLNIKYQDGADKKFVHILNGTAFAIGRTLIAILENYQEEDGSVTIPEALRKYTGFDKITPKK